MQPDPAVGPTDPIESSDPIQPESVQPVSIARWWRHRVSDAGVAWTDFSDGGGKLLSAALAFYALLSFAPAVYFVIRLLALVIPKDQAKRALQSEISRWLGEASSKQLLGLLDHLGDTHQHGITPFVSAIVLLYGSTRFFSAIRRSLHLVWAISPPKSSGFGSAVGKELYKRLVSFVMVIVVALLLLVSLVAKIVFMKATTLAGGPLADRNLWHVFEILLTASTLTFTLFSMFVVLPSVKINRVDAMIGAVDTAILLSFGSWLIGRYLAFVDKTTMFGAAGSFVFFLLWVHYASQVFLFGVALVGARAKRLGRPISTRTSIPAPGV